MEKLRKISLLIAVVCMAIIVVSLFALLSTGIYSGTHTQNLILLFLPWVMGVMMACAVISLASIIRDL